eukprot:Gb_22971 [translate_table: standard]
MLEVMGPHRDMDESLRIIEKFGGENYQHQKFKMRMVLIKEDLWSVIIDVGGDTVIDHINKIKMMEEQREAIDVTLKEEDIVMTLLCSLLQTYNNLIVSLESRDDDLKLDFVCACLLHEDKRRKDTRQSSKEESTFLVNKKDEKKERKEKKPMICFYCKNPGHMTHDCKKNKVVLRSKKNGKKSKREDQTIVGVTKETERLFVSTIGSTLEDAWYIDFGASQHIIAPKECSSELEVSEGNLAKGIFKEVLYAPNIAKHLLSIISYIGIIEEFIKDEEYVGQASVLGVTVDSKRNRVLAVIHRPSLSNGNQGLTLLQPISCNLERGFFVELDQIRVEEEKKSS